MIVFAVVFSVMVASYGVASPEVGDKVALASTETGEAASGPPARLGSKNIISDLITSIIQKFSMFLRMLGIDPVNIDRTRFGITAPVPSLFAFGFSLQSLKFGGISNIIVNYVDYGLLTSRLEYDFSWPEIFLDVVESEIGVRLLSQEAVAEYSGKISVRDVGVRGSARVSLGIVTGITVREFRVHFYVTELQATIKNLKVLDKDLTKAADLFINQAVFRTIKAHEKDISELIEIVVTRILDQIL